MYETLKVKDTRPNDTFVPVVNVSLTENRENDIYVGVERDQQRNCLLTLPTWDTILCKVWLPQTYKKYLDSFCPSEKVKKFLCLSPKYTDPPPLSVKCFKFLSGKLNQNKKN